MNVQSLTSLPSDPDITVLLVKKQIEELHNSKGDDGENLNTSSLANILSSNEDGSGRVYILSSSASSICTSDCETIYYNDRQMKTHKTKVKSASDNNTEDSIIGIQTIQNIYAGTEVPSTPQYNDGEFEEVALHTVSSASLAKHILHSEKDSKSVSVLKCMFPCIFRKQTTNNEN